MSARHSNGRGQRGDGEERGRQRRDGYDQSFSYRDKRATAEEEGDRMSRETKRRWERNGRVDRDGSYSPLDKKSSSSSLEGYGYVDAVMPMKRERFEERTHHPVRTFPKKVQVRKFRALMYSDSEEDHEPITERRIRNNCDRTPSRSPDSAHCEPRAEPVTTSLFDPGPFRDFPLPPDGGRPIPKNPDDDDDEEEGELSIINQSLRYNIDNEKG
ncbi:hypothetical protein PMAYCL1PPCAC_31310 [Pristionchus mayeri]|uniref:Uncharacterized protein n=1 Tax=Pristionchus mayeri TaxID=1317129 RepID=A0AAN5DEC0_9BILA|nr:hypothetical protein PMAYCL1PPCAC_31310 [Pristionchus mayeri]